MPIEQDDTIRAILTDSKVVAVVGASPKPYRDSNSISHFLEAAGYTVYRVNPKYAEIDAKTCYPDLASVPGAIDIVNVFRRSEAVAGIVDEALSVGVRAIWLQYGVVDPEAAERAEQGGIEVVMDHCIAVDHRRLLS